MAKKEPLAEMPAGQTVVDMTDKQRRDGSKGRAAFAEINKMTATGRITRQAAFVTYAGRIGSQPGTVAANFYRVARAEGAVQPRGSRKTAETSQTTPERRERPPKARTDGTNGTGDVAQIVAQLVTDVRALADAVKAESEANAELRRRLDSLRAAFG